MPNAKDANVVPGYKILAVGGAGSGKTTAFASLPGKKFIYIFDPNALASLQGFDIDYELFMPDVDTFALASLSKSGPKDKPTVAARPSETYLAWERFHENAIREGVLQTYDWVAFDSGTTFLDMVMDRILYMNGRAAQWPQQDDYGPQMTAFRNIMRQLTSMQKPDGSFVNVYLTGHLEPNKDEITGRVFNTPLMTGKLRQKIPILFSEMLTFESVSDSKGAKYQVRTAPNTMNPSARCSLRNVKPVEDVTLDFTKPIEGQGLGRLYK